jgi:aminocarboxymuconate-semialdehyde decarboxylase
MGLGMQSAASISRLATERGTMMRIDLHTHFYPPGYLRAMEVLDSSLEVTEDKEGNKIVEDHGARILTITREMSDPARRIQEMDEAGIDIQVLSLSTPNVYFAPEADAVSLAKVSNDYLAALCREFPDRFLCLASVPLNNVDQAIAELHRAIDDLGMNGLIIGSNINGVPLNSPQFKPFFEEVDRLGLAVLIHPMTPVGVELMGEYGLAPLVGFVFDTTLAITRMVYEGLMETFPNIKFIVGHLGGAIPYLYERINNGYRAYPECRENLRALPSEYLQRLYYDTVSFHEPALMCAYHTVGADQMVLGSDYPHVIGSIREAVTSVESLDLTADEKAMILGQNALRILRRNGGSD